MISLGPSPHTDLVGTVRTLLPVYRNGERISLTSFLGKRLEHTLSAFLVPLLYLKLSERKA